DATALLDSLIDLVVHVYAPLTAASLGPLVGRLRYAAPQWRADLKAGLVRAKQRLGHAQIGEHEWYWPAHERPASTRYAVDERVRLLAPFDPIVWDRRRFELLWDFRYRFEAYTPASKRKLGYYALPLLWRDRVIGWANVTAKDEQLDCQLGFVAARPREPVFDHELERELDRLRSFLSGYT
ncbi:MAG TPA: crosslink repair DNA glycosylase YcaQ family protein, partial [Polyangiales bacterium]